MSIEKYTYSFIGLGLIGGSVAKALRQAFPECTIKAYDLNQDALQLAKAEKIISEICIDLSDSLFECQYLFLCAPVSTNDKLLLDISTKIQPGCILTDVGSVKQTTLSAIQNAGLSSFFIGGHPMAGGEKTGYRHSNAQLLENSYYILTPTSVSSKDKINEFCAIINHIKAIPLVIDTKQHDYITACISHLPHIIAATLVNLVKESDSKEEYMKTIAAGGFKDIRRIASSSPVMWESICMTNTENILIMLRKYMQSLQKTEEYLENQDQKKIYTLFDTAKEYRDHFNNTASGPIKKVYDIYVDVPDVPGSLAKTATILANENISIKNIGIMNSREFQNGALRIEFYDENSSKNAMDILKKNKYKIF